MPTDYKHLAHPPRRRPRGRSGLSRRHVPAWMWLLLGLVPGVLVAALMYMHQPDPAQATRPAAGKVTTAPTAPKPPPPAKSAAAQREPEYDFYTLLEGEMTLPMPPEQAHPPRQEPPRARTAPQVAPAPEPPRARAAPGIASAPGPRATEPQSPEARPAPKPKKPAAGHYLLQAGAFSQPEPADRLKAQLAMLGLESTVQRVAAGPRQQVHYRVHIGPFPDLVQVDKVRSQLKAHRIDAIVLKSGAGS